jgi:hypothetical protein
MPLGAMSTGRPSLCSPLARAIGQPVGGCQRHANFGAKFSCILKIVFNFECPSIVDGKTHIFGQPRKRGEMGLVATGSDMKLGGEEGRIKIFSSITVVEL